MDLRDLQSILTIARQGSISHAAAKLFVTPSALTQLIQRTEKTVGTLLFVRRYNGCTLTEAGKIYVQAIQQILDIKHDTMLKIRDMVESPSVTMSIAFPPEHGVNMFTAVYPRFAERFPNVHVKIHEISVRRQQQAIAQGNIDLGFATLRSEEKTDDEYIPMVDEELLVVLPVNSAPARTAKMEPGCYWPVIDPKELDGYPFAELYDESTFRTWTQSIFDRAGVKPQTIVETTRPRTILQMIEAGMCGGMATEYHYKMWQKHDKIQFFALPDHPKWHVMAFYRKGGYLSKPMEYFVELAREYWVDEFRPQK